MDVDLPEKAMQQEDLPGHSFVPCKLLLAGEGDRGQQALAGAMLRLLGNQATVAVVSLPHIVVTGNGDAVQGCTSLMQEALRRWGTCVT